MERLIDDLLNLSRITRTEMKLEKVDLSALAGEIAAELRSGQPERPAEFVIAGGVVAEGDRGLLRIVLANLLGNAWKYTGKRTSARIEFGVDPRADVPAYFVKDDGAGFDMKFANNLFKPFLRLHAAAAFEGNGIGLATAQRIVARHGGRIWGDGAPDQGATFSFTLWEPNGHGHKKDPAG
jgi:light-regulated signal transduction histidine kinase (bacteriophytochrome)